VSNDHALALALEQLAAANNVIQAAQAAVEASLMAMSTSDALTTHARKLCREYQVRASVYRQTKR
jgi:hypothetical protein